MSHPSPEQLATVPLLAGLPDEYLRALAGYFEVEEHAAGHAIVREGSSGYAFYVVASGAVAVTQDGAELRRLGAGDFFGEISIIGEGRRTATVTALEPTVVWELFGTSFRVLQADHPDLAAALEAAMQQRLAGS